MRRAGALILDTYFAPRRAARRLLADLPSEPALLAMAFAASALALAARLEGLLRAAPEADRAAYVGSQVATSLLMGPLVLYALAALGHGVARLLGGAGSGRGARAALFWPLLALQPLVILRQIVVPEGGGGIAGMLLSGALAVLFVILWGLFLYELETPASRE